MKRAKRITRYFFFQLNECTACAEFLEDMALKGYKLVEFRGRKFFFEKMEPKNLKYSVEVFEKASQFDTRAERQTLEYAEYCKVAGWDLVAAFGKVVIFSTEEENAMPIETDDESKMRTIARGFFTQNLWFSIVMISVIFQLSIQLLNFESSVTNYMALSIIPMNLVLIIVGTSILLRFFCWYHKAKRSIKLGKAIEYPNRWNVKFFNKLILTIGISILLIGLILLNLGMQKNNKFIFVIMFEIAVIILVFFIGALINRSKFKRSTNIALSIGIGIGISYIMIIGIISIFIITSVSQGHENSKNVSYSDGNGSKVFTTIYNDKVPITLNDFGIRPMKFVSYEKDNDETIFARNRTYTLSTFSNDKDRIEISCEVFESNYKWIINKVISSETDEDRYGNKHKIEFDHKEKQLGVKNIYFQKARDYRIVIVYENKVIIISGDNKCIQDNLENIINKLE